MDGRSSRPRHGGAEVELQSGSQSGDTAAPAGDASSSLRSEDDCKACFLSDGQFPEPLLTSRIPDAKLLQVRIELRRVITKFPQLRHYLFHLVFIEFDRRLHTLRYQAHPLSGLRLFCKISFRRRRATRVSAADRARSLPAPSRPQSFPCERSAWPWQRRRTNGVPRHWGCSPGYLRTTVGTFHETSEISSEPPATCVPLGCRRALGWPIFGPQSLRLRLELSLHCFCESQIFFRPRRHAHLLDVVL